jgi:hypothetical protein
MYRPDKFANTFKEENGQALWDFLNTPENLLRMTTASYLGRPAVEPLSPALLQRFGPSIKRTRLKQMIGHMVRQVLEARGYRLDRSTVKISRIGNIFASGSRYVKIEG